MMEETVYKSPLYGDLDFLNKNLSEIHNRLAEISKFLEIIVSQVCKLNVDDIKEELTSIEYRIEEKERPLADKKYLHVKHNNGEPAYTWYLKNKGE